MDLFKCKYNDQWELTADEKGYSIVNKGDDGIERFYKVVTGPYGNPVIIAEPDLAIPTPTTIDYVNAQGNAMYPDEKIAGFICKDAGGKVVHRFSLSNPKHPEFLMENEGAEMIIDETRWHLRALFRKDQNRIIGHDAFYGLEKPDAVKFIELQDLEF